MWLDLRMLMRLGRSPPVKDDEEEEEEFLDR
jgi:hypothetical protein